MPKSVELGGLGDVPLPPKPWRFGGAGDAFTESLRSACRVEVIEPGAQGCEGKIREYISFRYRGGPIYASQGFQDRMSKIMLEKMIMGPMRFTLLRYAGDNLKLPGDGLTLESGSVVGVNLSKQTFAYPDSWFKSLLDAQASHTMGELGIAVTSQNSPHPFRPFGVMENLEEGPMRFGEGAGFLLLALVDERLRGMGLSQKLLSGVLTHHHDKVGARYVFAYGRTPQLSANQEASNEFKEKKAVSRATLEHHLQDVMRGEKRDWGVQLHHRAGANIICGLPDSVKDGESLNSGFLGIYDLGRMRDSGRI